jgi:hypothetical protein
MSAAYRIAALPMPAFAGSSACAHIGESVTKNLDPRGS